MLNRLVRSIALLSAPFVALATSVAAQGQTQGPPVVIPAIEVVATRVPAAPHDVPASIEVIRGDDLRARGARSLRDVLSLAAGVSIAPGSDGGPASSVPEFWGLREFDAFLLVVDGVPWGGALNPALATLNLQDIERVEVLRGPAPVTYGATSFVGVIHVVHKAGAEKSRSFAASGGSFGSAAASADLGFLLGSWQSRVSADFDKQGYRDDRTSFTRGHALWRVAKGDEARKTWFNLDVNVLRQDPASPHPREGTSLSTAVAVDANYNPANARMNEDRFALSAGFDRPAMKGGTWGTTISVTHSAQKMFRGFLTDISNNANNASGFLENIDVNDAYADTHLIWPEKSHMRFMLGADALFAGGEAKGATFNYTVPLNASTATSVAEPTTLDKDAEDQRLFLGAYASTDWHPVSRFTVNAGLRFNSTSERHGEANPNTTHTKLSGSIGAMFGLWERGVDHVRAFVNYRGTFKPAAFDFSLAENEDVLDPETSTSYEGGLKFRMMDGRFDIEASAFNMDFKNLVIATIVNNVPALANAGTTRFKGVELAADLRLAHAMYARATFSAHDGKFVDYMQEFDGVATQLGGKRFEMSAKQLWSAGVSLAPERGFIASANVNYVGDRYLDKRNTALAAGFATFDAGVGFRTGRAEFRIDGRNLGDKRDAVSESEFGDAQYYLMPARSVRVGVVMHY